MLTRPAALATLATVAALVAACGSTIASPDTKHRSPKDQKTYDEAVARGEVRLGMTRGEVRKARGAPRRKKRENHMGRKNVEVWIYAFSQVWFDHDGYVFDFRSVAG